MLVSLYSHAKDNTGTQANLYDILRGIGTGMWSRPVFVIRNLSTQSERDEAKKHLPGVTFSGLFMPTRNLEACVGYTQMVICDVDKLEPDRLHAYREALVADPYVHFLFVSPSGTGLKFAVRVDSTVEQHYDAFYCVESYLATQYGINLDPSGKDICRLCFVSYDPNLHYNAQAMVMHVTANQEARKVMYGDRDFSKKGFFISSDDKYKFDVIVGWTEMRKPIAQGSNMHIYYLACSANRCGVDKERIFALCLQKYTELPVDALKETIFKAYKQHVNEFATQEIYDFESEQKAIPAGSQEFTIYSAEEVFQEFLERPVLSISTGDPEIDEATGGFQRGMLYAFVGPEKSYKSAYAVSIAVDMALMGIDVIYACGEMSRFQLIRMIALIYLSSEGDRVDMSIKESAEANHQRIGEFMRLIGRKLIILDGDNFTETAVVAAGNKVKKDTGLFPALVVIDGFQNWQKTSNREHESDGVGSKNIKNMAKSLDTAVVIIAHTDSNCKPWNRNPIEFIRNKIMVRRNLDASFGFSRFVTHDSFPEGDVSNYELRRDVAHIKVTDYRSSGKTVNRVIAITDWMKMRLAPEFFANDYEVKITKDGWSNGK
jgi:hypothetical protein